MSYLSQPTSKTDYGVVVVGNYINVDNGLISLEQDLSPNANVNFNSGSYNQLYAGGNLVVTDVTPTAGAGINLSNVSSNGYHAHFTVTNTGVLSLVAGTGISISGSTGNVTIATTGTSYINVIGISANYTPTSTDEYIGVNSVNAVTITLPTGIQGRVYYIKDEHGQGSGKINIIPQSGDKIDGANTYVIGVPYQSVGVVYRGTGWWII